MDEEELYAEDSFKYCIDFMLGIKKEKPKDYWKEKAEIPLMTIKPFDEYDEEMPEEEVLTVKVDTRGAQQRNPFNALVCASTGVGKTRLIKNLIKGFYKQGFKILVIEPKSFEMMNMSKKGQGQRIHPLDKNEKLPVACYAPSFIYDYMEKNMPDITKRLTFYSPDMRKLDYPEIWQSFGIPIKVAKQIVDLIAKGKNNIDDFEKQINTLNLHHTTAQAALSSLVALKVTNFFSSKKKLELEKEWNENNVVVVNYMSRDGAMMNTDIGLILDLVRDIGLKESLKGLDNVSKKLIVFDDAFYYAGTSASMATRLTGGVNLAIRNIVNCQNNFRTWGIDTIFVVQNPASTSVYSQLIDGCTTKFVSYTENTEPLNGKIPSQAYDLITNTDPSEPMLHVDEENYIFQWIYVRGKTQFTTGFPFDCTLGHS